MKRSKKIWLSVVASLLVVVGVAAWIVIKQLPDLITVEYETNHYESSDTFERIYLVADEVDVSFTVSPDGICRVECYEPAKDTHKVTMKGGILLLQKESKKAWYEYFGVQLEGTSKNYPFAIWAHLLPQLFAAKIPQYTKYSGISATQFGTKSAAQIIKK